MANTLTEIQSEPKERRVKPKNADELPSSAQLYFLLHRAKEKGEEVIELPVRRDMAALAISLMKDHDYTYRRALKSVRVAIAMRR